LIHNSCANVTASTTESFGMTVIESMASGTPSIVPNVPGISELTEGTGLTFPRDDMEALADQVLKIIGDDTLRRNLSEASLRRSRDFDGAVIADQFEELYEDVLAHHEERLLKG
jgi:glycosyltransferase involved in cell wall biosynthesis